jgi:hypothetical protein
MAWLSGIVMEKLVDRGLGGCRIGGALVMLELRIGFCGD